ncbi:permease [Rhodothermaceae bacterium RA]|nr:permease [Rhodothermaceae bacterium RA]
MNTFDRHILRRLFSGFLFFVGTLIVFFIVLHYVEFIDDFMDRGATMRDVFLVYYPSYIPEIVKLTSPLALFLSCVYLTGKLAQELQLIALQASGVSLYRLLRPYLVIGVAVTGFMFWFNGWVVPRTNATVLAFEQQYLKDGPGPADVNDIHRQHRPGQIVSVGFYDRTAQTAIRVSLQAFDEADRLVSRIDASRMEWVDSLQVWRLRHATLRRFEADGRVLQRTINQLDTALTVYPRDFARTERDVESMTIPEARGYVDALRRSGANQIGRTLVGYYVKFAYPFANLILVLIALPLASVRRRGGQAAQLALGLLTAFAYLALQKLTEPFGYSGELPPAATAWIPHAVFLGVALILLLRARK